MSANDPRILAPALEDLQSEIARWSSLANDMLSTATDAQRHAHEFVGRAFHNASIILERAKGDEDAVTKTLSAVASSIDRCTTAVATAKVTLHEAENSLTNANMTLEMWKSELEKALSWLARAEARLEKAIQELDRAKRALHNAEWNLSNAESRLRAAKGDPNRRETNAETAAVSRARSEVLHAKQIVAVAEQEVAEAREEVEKAKARVACCKKAVTLATDAVSTAQGCISQATQAINFAERSLEFAYAAESLVKNAHKEAKEELDAAESMMFETRAALEFTDSAATHLRNADRAEESAQVYAKNVTSELGYRIQSLHELNRPSLFSGAYGTYSTEGTHGYPYQKARKEFMYESLVDSNVAKHIKGWIRQEVNRVGNSGYWRSPPGYDVGHKVAGIDHAENLQWENSGMNRSKGAKFKR